MLDYYSSLTELFKQHVADAEIIVIHSSLMHFKLTQDIKWPLLSVLKSFITQGYTIAIPCFTLSFTKTGRFDDEHSKSEVGMLGDWFLELYDVLRTLHPIYSFAYAGPLASEISQISIQTCFSEDSIFSYFNRKKTRYILFGCDYQYLTQLHYYEEREKVPYRYHKTFEGRFVHRQNEIGISTSMFVRDLDVNPINDFSTLFAELEKKNKIRKKLFLSGDVKSFDEQDVSIISQNLLRQDIFSFVKDKAKLKYEIQCKANREANPPLNIAVMGCSHLSFIVKSMSDVLSSYFKNRKVNVFSPEFGQTQREIIDEHSSLAQFSPNFIFFTDALEDIFNVNFLDGYLFKHLAAFENYLSLIARCCERFKAKIFVNRFFSLSMPINRQYDYQDPEGVHALIDYCNRQLMALKEKNKNLMIVHIDEKRNEDIIDYRLLYIGRWRYSETFAKQLAEKYIGYVLASIGLTARVIVLDLDQTLWGGVLGEDGFDGIQLGGDYPGRAYKDFQTVLLKLKERGIALAILSKNDESSALHVIDEHEEMLIRRESIATYYINWREKSENLLNLSKEIGVALENILFIDDNPVEREKIRVNLPAVNVLDLPDDPTLYVDTLLHSPYIECLELTDEDRKRIEFFSKKKAIDSRRHQFENIIDFYKSQQIKVIFNTLNESNFSRAMQLIQKTNQFNTTSKRLFETEINQLLNLSYHVVVVGLSDIITDFENIGLLILNPSHQSIVHIELLLLSCRVLGKGIESSMLAYVYDWAKTHGKNTMHGEIIFTPRNTPVRELYAHHGFNMIENTDSKTLWALNMNEKTIEMPKWLQCLDKTIRGQHAKAHH